MQKDKDYADLKAQLEAAQAELEKERLRLAACGVAALSNTEESIKNQKLAPDSEYYSGSYEDVCRAVNREMHYRTELERVKAAAEKMAMQLRHYVNSEDEIGTQILKDYEEIREAALELRERLMVRNNPSSTFTFQAVTKLLEYVLELTAPESSPAQYVGNGGTQCLECGAVYSKDVWDKCPFCSKSVLNAQTGQTSIQSSPAPLESQEELWKEVAYDFSREKEFRIATGLQDLLKSKFILARRTEGRGRTEGYLQE